MLAPVVAAFCRAHEDVVLNWSLGSRRVDLIAEEFDVAVRFAPLPETWRKARLLLRGEYHVVATPAIVESVSGQGLTDALAAIPIIGLHVTHLRNRWPLCIDGVVTWLPVRVGLWVDDVGALIELAIAGTGATLLPDFLVAGELADGRLVCLTVTEQTNPAKVFAETNPQGSTKLADEFVEQLAAPLDS